jgi:hypothetical protein
MIVLNFAGTQFLSVNAGILRDHALHQLLVGHFSARTCYVLFVFEGGFLAMVSRKTGLAGSRAAAHDQQVGTLQSAKYFIQIGQSGGYAEDLVAALREHGNAVISTRRSRF